MSTSHELKSLPKDTVRLIGSSQVITSVYSVVKELLENSFDADATTVDVKLESYGFDKIEVRDNGCGISKTSIPFVALRYHTSKISSFNDLESLTTFGFRGEALGSLCAVSDLSVSSKTADEDVSHTYSFDHNGKVRADQPSHLGQGTTISASNLFSNMPVRRQYYKTIKKRKEELKKVEDLCMAYGIIKPGVRLVLRHNKEIVWQKTPASDTRSALLGVLGRKIFSNLEHKTQQLDVDIGGQVEAFLPNKSSDVTTTSRSNNDRSFLAINGRPVHSKDIEKCVRQHYCHAHQCEGRHPVYYISLQVPTTQLDVNVDPNKMQVMLHQQKQIINTIKTLCEDLYGSITKLDTAADINSTDMTLNDSVCSITPENLSYIENNQDKTCSDNNTSDRAKTIDSCGVSARLNDKFGNVGKDRANSETETHNTDNFEKGYVIEFHQENKENSVPKATSEYCREDKVDTEFVCSKTMEKRDILDETLDITNDNTECEKINFDLIDSDLKELLKTQEYGKARGESDLQISLDLDQCLSDQHNFTEIVQDTDQNIKTSIDSRKIVESEIEKENLNHINLPNTSDTIHDVANDGAKKDITKNKGVECSKVPSAYESHRHIEPNCTELSKNTHEDVGKSWSRGTLPQTSSNSLLQPVMLLAPGSASDRNKRPPSPSQDLDLLGFTPPTKKKSFEPQMDQPRLYEMIGSSGDKFSSGFVAFSKHVRPKVVEDNPDASYDDITNIVKSQWEKLPDDEREEFRLSGSQQIQELRKTVTNASRKQLIGPKLDKRVAPVKGLPSIKDQLLAAAGKKAETKKPIKSVKVAFSMSQLKQLFSTEPKSSPTQDNKQMKLIGSLKYYNGWVCCHGNQLKLINPHRVEETLLHRELMADHVVNASRLDEPQTISESSIGGAHLYQTLLDLIPEESNQTYTYIEDKRLTANGIQIRCHLDQHGKPVCELTGLTTAMPMYGQSDLQEILDLIANTDATTLHKSRPLKVVYYLQGEAVRMVRQRPVQRTREDMLDILQQMITSLPVDCVQCLHNKPFLHSIYDMEKIPVTQSQR